MPFQAICCFVRKKPTNPASCRRLRDCPAERRLTYKEEGGEDLGDSFEGEGHGRLQVGERRDGWANRRLAN
jgi:hypothetical protein